ncbi:unnamed protein product [Arctogadus glacialis]
MIGFPTQAIRTASLVKACLSSESRVMSLAGRGQGGQVKLGGLLAARTSDTQGFEPRTLGTPYLPPPIPDRTDACVTERSTPAQQKALNIHLEPLPRPDGASLNRLQTSETRG